MTIENILDRNNPDIINNTLLILSDAESAHKKNPADMAHDWQNHHVPVLENMMNIIEKENLNNEVNVPACLCAAAWHDYKRHSGDFKVMDDSINDRGMSLEFGQKVKDIINEHSFKDKRETIEGLLLWSADKIEYVSKDRYLAAKKGLPKLIATMYHMMMKKRIPKVIEEMQDCPFESAKEIFKTKYNEFKEFINTNSINELSWFTKLM